MATGYRDSLPVRGDTGRVAEKTNALRFLKDLTRTTDRLLASK
jgi:hypothetical protein